MHWQKSSSLSEFLGALETRDHMEWIVSRDGLKGNLTTFWLEVLMLVNQSSFEDYCVTLYVTQQQESWWQTEGNLDKELDKNHRYVICKIMLHAIISIVGNGRILCVSFSKTNSGWCIYHLVVRSNFNFLHNSQWVTFPTQSCLVIYSLSTSLQLSLIMWLIALSITT